MSDSEAVVGPLASQLYRRLEFRYEPFKAELRKIQAECARDGLANSGALVRRVLLAFDGEAQVRAEIIEAEFRKYRLSCSPKDIMAAKVAFRIKLDSIIKQRIQYIRYECECILNILQTRARDRESAVFRAVEDAVRNSTSSCAGLLAAVVEEVIMAAETDIRAVRPEERPGYVFNTTITGPVASVAQGQASVGQIHQQTSSVYDVRQLVSMLDAAIAEWSPENRTLIAGAEAMIKTEILSPEPDRALLKSAAKKIGDVALKAGEAVATQALLSYLRSHGWTS